MQLSSITNMSLMDFLPEELHVEIFRYLEITKQAFHERKFQDSDFFNLRLVSREWKRMASDPKAFPFWRKIVRNYGIYPDTQEEFSSFLEKRSNENRENGSNLARGIATSLLMSDSSPVLCIYKTAENQIAFDYRNPTNGTQKPRLLKFAMTPYQKYFSRDSIYDLAIEFRNGNFLQNSESNYFYFTWIAAKRCNDIRAQLDLSDWYLGLTSKGAQDANKKSLKWCKRAAEDQTDATSESLRLRIKDRLADLESTSMEVDDRVSSLGKRKVAEALKSQPPKKKRRKGGLDGAHSKS
jgi:hypothetical protein